MVKHKRRPRASAAATLPDCTLATLQRRPTLPGVRAAAGLDALVVLAASLRYGRAASAFIFNLLPSMGGPAPLFPANFGYPLWVVYGVWILTVVLLYPVCLWFARVKATRGDWWLSYL